MSATINIIEPTPTRTTFPSQPFSPVNEPDVDGNPRPRASNGAEPSPKTKGKPLFPPTRPPSSRKPAPSLDIREQILAPAPEAFEWQGDQLQPAADEAEEEAVPAEDMQGRP